MDIAAFVERTTYEIWNQRRPELVDDCYGSNTVVWADGGDVLGGAAVTALTRHEQTEVDDIGFIPDLIWAGDDDSGYRTSMRWLSRGVHVPTGRPVQASCTANCVVRAETYLEEWSGVNGRQLVEQLELDVHAAAGRLGRSQAPRGTKGWERTRSLGVRVPAVPPHPTTGEQFVAELIDDLYNSRSERVFQQRYAPGAPYAFGVSRWRHGPDAVRDEVGRLLGLGPDLRTHIEELYGMEDGPGRHRVAVRHLLSGTGRTPRGDRQVALSCFHHVHVRDGLVVAEFVEYDELSLHAQLL